MKFAVIGAGPGGLYAALLLKKSDPRREVVVVEKNPEGATYGWGVVFSDRTLSEFREADYATYSEIIDRFVEWDAIDIRYRGEIVRAGGQGFSGIARIQLLDLLVRRCRALGVDIRFETEADAGQFAGSDAVVAADGVHSIHRSARREVFGTRYQEGASRYIWFGTNYPFDSFTFSFESTAHGLFQAHAYPYDGTTSTFIVETAEETWRRAGLDSAGERDSIAFCERVFASHLRGRPLMSNNSKWVRFVTVMNRRWRDGNLVLLGDAAHTAHFSIGSGTKLAMEDSIALARAVDTHDTIENALDDYELERRPRVERFQEAARQSRTYFENTHRYLHMEPLQFAFHLLTRSGRIDYNALRVRDASLVGEVDRWFAGGKRNLAAAPPPAFVPTEIGGLMIHNRLVYSGDLATDARPGFGLVVLDGAVSAHGRATPEIAEADDVSWAGRVQDVHGRTGARAALRLVHAGPRASCAPRAGGVDRPLATGGWAPLAASAVAYSERVPLSAALDERTRAEVLEDYSNAARAAAAASFDLVVLDAARGGLLHSFLSPLTNRRSDAYGRDRAAFPLEVLSAVVASFSGPVGVRLCADDRARGGSGVDDAVGLARRLRAAGAAFFEIDAGWATGKSRPRYDLYESASLAERVRNESGAPVIATGAIFSVDEVNTLVSGGRADLCVVLPS